MSRAQVRFQPGVLRSPDEINSPHHDRAPNPKGILLKSGAFDKKRNGKSSRRDRRYSTPVEATANMQSMSHADPYLRHDYRSRRRSISGSLLDTSHSQRLDQDNRHDPPPYYPRTPQASSSRRESLQAASRPVLSTLNSQDPHATPNRRESKGWHDDGYGSQAADEHLGGGRLMPAPPVYPGGTPYYPPSSSLPAGFLYGAATSRSSAYHSSPGSQNDTHYLPDRDHHRRAQPSLKEIKTVRGLHSPRIVWNIAFPFSSALLDSHSRLSLSELDQFATTPSGIDRFVIKFDDSKSQRLVRSFWRSMRVSGSRATEHQGSTVFIVTIRDVLNAIFDFFQMPLTREEYASLSNDEAQMVLKSQRRRMGRHAYGFGEPLRADLLGDYLRFEGVQVTSLRDRRIYFSLELSRW